MAPSVLGWGSRWILQKPWKCRAVYGWFRGVRAPDWAAGDLELWCSRDRDRVPPPHWSRDVGRPGRGHRREHSPLRGEPPGPAGAPGRAVGPGQHPATRGAAHTLASSAPRPAWGAAPPGVWLSPPEQVGVSAASPRPHPRPLLRGVPPPRPRLSLSPPPPGLASFHP